ncbi:60S acidic ribosomal protein P0-like [Otolemur garnettii]|uniref:60S acidic ribosomal protein P0-like n=1 Tax=Otolemur garnettii TaxID=30611 RepID=UPI000C7EF53B|nr:60S acidic ribosomal protein P0-like [Otolemur garnettii]
MRSKQMKLTCMSLREKTVVLIGKNTRMHKAIQEHLENNSALEKLLPHILGNVGFVLSKEDLTEIRDMLLANMVPAATLAGATASREVPVPAQNTDLEPEKIFLQALGITTKISRGTHFLEGVRNVANVCMQIGYPTVSSVPHSILKGYKRVLALSMETDHTFPLVEKVKAFLADTCAFVVAAPMAATTIATPATAAAPAKVEAKKS